MKNQVNVEDRWIDPMEYAGITLDDDDYPLSKIFRKGIFWRTVDGVMVECLDLSREEATLKMSELTYGYAKEPKSKTVRSGGA